LAPATPKTTDDTEVKADTKIGETAKDTNTVKTADQQDAGATASSDAKPANSLVPVIAATDQTIAPVQPAAPVAVAPAAPAPAAVMSATTEISQAEPLAKQTVTVAAKTTAAPKTKMGDFAALQDGADKAAAARAHDEMTAAPAQVSTDKTAPVGTDAQAALPKTTGDAVQQSSLTTPTPDLVQAVAPPAAPAAPVASAPIAVQAAPVPIAGVAIEIATQAQAGKNHFEIRLDPPELGRIEVRLDVDRDGHVTSRLIADRSDTLNLLRNDASGLQRALQDAGLKTTDNGLQFSLRDQGMSQQQNAAPSTPNTAQIVVQDSTLPAGDVAQRNYSRLAGLRGGIDIRV
jgi:flagellar hook-length control protein FliK